MTDELMSEARHIELIKAAEETIGMVNIGVDCNAALAKIAADKDLNDNEVSIVAHAVNNSRQLAHIQSTTGEEREDAFPLIDPDKVRSYGELQPTTNADVSTGNRYGDQETPGESTEQKFDDPDATEVHEEQLEKAAHLNYIGDGDFRLRKEPVDNAALLRDAWGLDSVPAPAEYIDPNPFAKISHYRIGIEEADVQYCQLVQQCTDSMEKVAEAMRRVDAPPWADVEHAAVKLGADDTTLDMIFDLTGLANFGEKRPERQEKTAGTLYVSERALEIAEDCVRANTFWKSAADVHAAGQVLRGEYVDAEASLLPKEAKSETARLGAHFDMKPGDFAEAIEGAPREFLGVSDELLQDLRGGPVSPGTKSDLFTLKPGVRGELKSYGVRNQIQDLMSDDFIGGHSLPEVVEAFNAAMSVNPHFGRAELVSYVRQHLATDGAVPMDQQIRARESLRGTIEREIEE